MKLFMRENPTIAFGIGLPLLLVVIFLLISWIPALLVAPPQYDVLYATNYPSYQKTVQISVVNQKVQVLYQHQKNAHQQPRLWRYNSKTGAVKEIPIIVPIANAAPPEDPAATVMTTAMPTVIEVPELAALTIDSSSIAPDGYEFSTGSRYSGAVFGGLFNSRHYDNKAILIKKGRSIRLSNMAADRYYYHDTHFIGWVLPQ